MQIQPFMKNGKNVLADGKDRTKSQIPVTYHLRPCNDDKENGQQTEQKTESEWTDSKNFNCK